MMLQFISQESARLRFCNLINGFNLCCGQGNPFGLRNICYYSYLNSNIKYFSSTFRGLYHGKRYFIRSKQQKIDQNTYRIMPLYSCPHPWSPVSEMYLL